jgi:hypothetical protein
MGAVDEETDGSYLEEGGRISILYWLDLFVFRCKDS